jgi:hypothetical protein
MSATTEPIRAAVNQAILTKADRLFTNDDRGVFVELLQNARCAGATTVHVTIEDIPGESGSAQITVLDNGRGIEDFQSLLTLGGSDWSVDTQQKEDPAGMGFFAPCRSEVEVHSAHRSVTISPAVFLGEGRPKSRRPKNSLQAHESASGDRHRKPTS